MVLRVCVVVLAKDCPRTLSSVVKDVVVNTRFPVLVVDQSVGEESPIKNWLYSFEVRQALESDRVRLHQGRGWNDVIGKMAPLGFTHLVWIPGDGSCDASEVNRLVARAESHPWDLILATGPFTSHYMAPLFLLQERNWWVLANCVPATMYLRFVLSGRGVQQLATEPLKLENRWQYWLWRSIRGAEWATPRLRRLWRRLPIRDTANSRVFVNVRALDKWLGKGLARALTGALVFMTYMIRPNVRHGLNQFYLRIAPDDSWVTRQKKALAHLFVFAIEQKPMEISPAPMDFEMLPVLGALAPVDVRQLSYLRDFERRIQSEPILWSKFYPYWTQVPEGQMDGHILYEDLDDVHAPNSTHSLDKNA